MIISLKDLVNFKSVQLHNNNVFGKKNYYKLALMVVLCLIPNSPVRNPETSPLHFTSKCCLVVVVDQSSVQKEGPQFMVTAAQVAGRR